MTQETGDVVCAIAMADDRGRPLMCSPGTVLINWQLTGATFGCKLASVKGSVSEVGMVGGLISVGIEELAN